MKKILEDGREIIMILWGSECADSFRVGSLGITAIKAYGETGEYGYIPFLAIMHGSAIWQRIPASHVRIVYRGKEDER